ncbi:msl8626 [Mesorhizobium japonicum MAFF 303099]|uniref:Msl8626 protein n=1 Tax=Mesorhizobium japonicum (strain LMG 29417 / CECT 9101 / MAFF 303099) TaxID=266835 RepID=Q98HY2_RHILO|nr:msl8626 [Mesorhizobium japonicum MAFF 303099]
MLLAVIAGEGPGAGVEAAVAVRAVFVPVTRPRLGIAIGIDHPRFDIVAADRCRADTHVTIVVTVIVVAVSVRRWLVIGQRATDQGAGGEAKHTGGNGVAIAVVAVMAPFIGVGRGQGHKHGGGHGGGQHGCLENSVHLGLLRTGPCSVAGDAVRLYPRLICDRG